MINSTQIASRQRPKKIKRNHKKKTQMKKTEKKKKQITEAPMKKMQRETGSKPIARQRHFVLEKTMKKQTQVKLIRKIGANK